MAGLAARRYVKAIYELALDAGTQDTVLDQLKQLNGLLQEHEELKQMLLNPSVKKNIKITVFDQVTTDFDLSPTVAGLMRLLIRKNRVELLDDIIEEYIAQEHERLGIISMEIATATPLDETMAKNLREKFEQSTGKIVEISARVDKSLIGGMVARIGGTIYDGSIEHQLKMIQQRLGE